MHHKITSVSLGFNPATDTLGTLALAVSENTGDTGNIGASVTLTR
jgi:hypothetical protein